MAAPVVCDTDVLIEFLKGRPDSVDAIRAIRPEDRATTAVTLMELYAGAFDQLELRRIQKAFHSFQIVPVTPEAARIALQVMEGFSKSHGVSVPDALIAGAAIAWRAPLFTYNRKHFQPLESQIHVP